MRLSEPKLRGTGRHAEPCPRKALAAAIQASGHSYAAHSRMIGRWHGYLARFVNEGQPIALTAREHQILADHFGLEERGLGIRDLRAIADVDCFRRRQMRPASTRISRRSDRRHTRPVPGP